MRLVIAVVSSIWEAPEPPEAVFGGAAGWPVASGVGVSGITGASIGGGAFSNSFIRRRNVMLTN